MKKGRIVSIVDDDPSMRKSLGRLCESAGYQVSLYESSEDFLETEGSEITDCLILDVDLPGKSGLELQRELVAARASCPILFITAFEDEEMRQSAIQAGAIEFFGKPLDVDHLLTVIQRAMATE